MLYKKKITLLLVFLATIMSGSVFALESFSNKNTILKFEIEGVSVITPVKEIAELLTKRGWILADSPKTGMTNSVMLTFVKDVAELRAYRGTYKSKQGSTGYKIIIKMRKTPEEFSQSVSVERLAPFDLKSYETPSPADLVHQYATALKKTICNGIIDKDEQQNVCPTDTKEQVYLGPGESRSHKQVRLLPSNNPGQLDAMILSNSANGRVLILRVKREFNR